MPSRIKHNHEDVGVTNRKSLTPGQRLKLWEQHKGICVICELPIDGVREKWIDEHIKPLAEGGTNDMDNRGPAHVLCAKAKTGEDAKRLAKARRTKRKHLGIKRATSRPLMGTKESGWRKKMNGDVERR